MLLHAIPAHSRLASLDWSAVNVAESSCAGPRVAPAPRDAGVCGPPRGDDWRGSPHGLQSRFGLRRCWTALCRAAPPRLSPWPAVPAGPAASGTEQSIRSEIDDASSPMAQYPVGPPESAHGSPERVKHARLAGVDSTCRNTCLPSVAWHVPTVHDAHRPRCFFLA